MIYPKVSANMIVGSNREPYLKQCIESIYDCVDEIIVVANTNNQNSDVLESYSKIKVYYRVFVDFCSARNTALSLTSPDMEYILWVDADEVHFPSKLAEFISASNGYDIGVAAFYHFIKDFKHYQSIDERYILLRKGIFTWTSKVDEYPLFAMQPKAYVSEYKYHHYGYTKPQRELWNGWMERAKLLGDNSPWFKDDDPDTILDSRIVIDYKGEYPIQMKGHINV